MSYEAVRAVLDRSRATGSARLVLIVLAEHLNRSTRRCDPSVETLARECKASTRTIRRLLRDLEGAEEIKTLAGGGRNRCNSYTIKVAENPDKDVSVSSSETLTTMTGFKAETLTNQVGNPDNVVRQTRKNRKERDNAESDFAEFWKAYPRKVAKEAARRTWKRVASELPPLHELLASLTSHATSRQWQDPQFIPHPATWLNGRRWQDTPPPMRSALPQSNGGTLSCL